MFEIWIGEEQAGKPAGDRAPKSCIVLLQKKRERKNATVFLLLNKKDMVFSLVPAFCIFVVSFVLSSNFFSLVWSFCIASILGFIPLLVLYLAVYQRIFAYWKLL